MLGALFYMRNINTVYSIYLMISKKAIALYQKGVIVDAEACRYEKVDALLFKYKI